MAAITLTEENFEKEVKQSALPVLVSYREGEISSDCVDRVSERMDGVLKCCKINAKASPELVKRYRIRSVPTILLFKRGQVTDTIVGETRTEQLMRILS
ncbi:MAG: thioredoxin domain-containing protein [Oscillospiraceae bacterium]|nr:thioredoxin domain-containing protein [Oscillospiraceae bacterium]